MFTDILSASQKKMVIKTTKKNFKKRNNRNLPFPVYSSYYHQVFIKPTTSLYKLLLLLLRYGCNGCLVWRLKADNPESHCTIKFTRKKQKFHKTRKNKKIQIKKRTNKTEQEKNKIKTQEKQNKQKTQKKQNKTQ